MNETFLIDVPFQGDVIEFEGSLHLTGYLHKIEIDVYGTPVFFEPDEERNYRALVQLEQVNRDNLSIPLLQAIALQLDSLLG